MAVLFAVMLACGAARADVPAPGTHGITKTWLSMGAEVTNFSPFTSMLRIGALTADVHNGVWFGVGNTLEHIDSAGAMLNYQISSEWLWTVEGISPDGSGKVWFSLGQSGRIGTIDARGQVRTRVIIARKHNPDVRAIAFDRRGTLWFTDVGRNSIGRQSVDGTVKEIPLPNEAQSGFDYGRGLAVCASRIYVATQSAHGETLFVVEHDLHSLKSVLECRQGGNMTIACDGEDRLWFAHASYESSPTSGYLDRTGRAHIQRDSLQGESLYAGARGTILFAGWKGTNNEIGLRLIVASKSGNRLMRWTLPVLFGSFNQTLTTTPDGTVWFDAANPHSVVRLHLDK